MSKPLNTKVCKYNHHILEFNDLLPMFPREDISNKMKDEELNDIIFVQRLIYLLNRLVIKDFALRGIIIYLLKT